jgi:hypothetical protein
VKEGFCMKSFWKIVFSNFILMNVQKFVAFWGWHGKNKLRKRVWERRGKVSRKFHVTLPVLDETVLL